MSVSHKFVLTRYYDAAGNVVPWPSLLLRLQNIQWRAAEIAAQPGDTFRMEAADTCARLLHSQVIERRLGWRGSQLESELFGMDQDGWLGPPPAELNVSFAASARSYVLDLINAVEQGEIGPL